MKKLIMHSLSIFAFLFLVGCGSAEPASTEHGAVVPIETVQEIEKPASCRGLSCLGSALILPLALFAFAWLVKRKGDTK